jgi:Putative transposase/Transposase zinc-binding domain
VASLAPAYAPRKPTETVLHQLVRANLESFIAYARANYDGGLPRYVEQEFRAYVKCGDFSEGFSRVRCDACGHDLLVAFSCHGRSICPSCCGRRMASVAAFLVDRVLPDVPLRQFVLSLPYELRRLAAFKADVLTALARIFVEAVFASYRARAKSAGLDDAQCGSVLAVHRFGSLNLNVHFHVLVLDGVFTRDEQRSVLFHPAPAPTLADLSGIVERTHRRTTKWLDQHGYLDGTPLEERSNEPPAQTALDACAAIAMRRGNVASLPRADAPDAADEDHERRPDKTEVAVEQDGFNLHAGVQIEAGDDMGRERLCRYAARPPLSLERLRRLPGGRIAYRLKYVSRGRGKHRVMSGVEFMARLAAITAPPRYPLLRYAGVLAPRSAWRRDVVPRPRERRDGCDAARTAHAARAEKSVTTTERTTPKASDVRDTPPPRPASSKEGGTPSPPATSMAQAAPNAAGAGTRPDTGEVIRLAPNIISVRHWDRLLGGLLYAVQPRVDWATLLRRSFSVDVLECSKCHGRLRMVAVITEHEPVRRILTHLGMPTEPPPVARARDPTDDTEESGDDGQLALGLE